MTFRKKIDYSQLPPELASVFPEADLLKAYDCPETGSLIVWRLDRAAGKQKELEFSLAKKRLLSREERQARLPPPEEVALPEHGLLVVKGAELEAGSDVRYETYTVYDAGSGGLLVKCEQVYFALMLASIENVVLPALEEAAFPATYAGWSVRERADYWASTLYRLRHQTGETGAEEDAVFGPGLIASMQAIDPAVVALLPEVLRELARMETMHFDTLRQSFNARTGLAVS